MKQVIPSSAGGKGDLLDGSVVWTPPIEALAKAIVEQMRGDLPGLIVTGLPRTGKSSACRYIIAALAEVLGYPVACIRWRIPKDHGKDSNEFIEECASQSGVQIGKKSKKVEKRKRLIQHLEEQARMTGTHRIVLLIDEAQNLLESEYTQILHIYDLLEWNGLRPFVVLMGEPGLLTVQAEWVPGEAEKAVSRFATRRHYFHPVLAADFEAVLEGFDSDKPEESAAYRTHQGLYAEGFRVKHLAPRIIEGLQSMSDVQGISWELQLPMQFLRGTVLHMLNYIRDCGVRPEQMPLASVNDCIIRSNFVEVWPRYVKR